MESRGLSDNAKKSPVRSRAGGNGVQDEQLALTEKTNTTGEVRIHPRRKQIR